MKHNYYRESKRKVNTIIIVCSLHVRPISFSPKLQDKTQNGKSGFEARYTVGYSQIRYLLTFHVQVVFFRWASVTSLPDCYSGSISLMPRPCPRGEGFVMIDWSTITFCEEFSNRQSHCSKHNLWLQHRKSFATSAQWSDTAFLWHGDYLSGSRLCKQQAINF